MTTRTGCAGLFCFIGPKPALYVFVDEDPVVQEGSLQPTVPDPGLRRTKAVQCLWEGKQTFIVGHWCNSNGKLQTVFV